MPNPARPLTPLVIKPPKPDVLDNPSAPPMPPPIPPRSPPNAVPTPGTKAAIGATFLITLPTLPNAFFIFLKKPNSSKPVIGFRLATPAPTTAFSGLIPSSLNFISSIDSNCSSSNISGGKTTSPALKCANSVSSPCPCIASSCPMGFKGADCFTCPLCNKLSIICWSSADISCISSS